MHYFTSITTNYLPKARVLAHSIREYCPNSFFTLVVSDLLPSKVSLENEPFDEILYIKDLNVSVSNLDMWIFQHTVVELCTAIKGSALVKLLNDGRSEKVVYLDPDTAVFDSMKELEKRLDQNSVVLTPHITIPEKTDKGICDNEICALQHGVYNLGFVAVRNTEKGMAFASWWRDRLVGYCYDDIPRGLFTDQRWVDMAPAMFDDIFIERSPAYNVSTWNLSSRSVTKKNDCFFVNGLPLQFYHFSGFDSGANFDMMKQYGDTAETWELREWYIGRQEAEGQSEFGKQLWHYDKYSNGETIPKKHRRLLAYRKDVQEHFEKSNPFIVDGECVYSWMMHEVAQPNASVENLQQRLEEIERINSQLRMENMKLRKYLAPALWLRRKWSDFVRK